jgi:hypothetical protein
MKMQPVKFRSVDEFLEFLPADERRITEVLRSIVLEAIPGVTEKLAYNVPYYKRHKNICFIWPASVLWGKTKTYEGVRFGFTSGNLLTDEAGWLAKENRKQVYWRDFKSVQEIDVALLKSYIYEAVIIDQHQKK